MSADDQGLDEQQNDEQENDDNANDWAGLLSAFGKFSDSVEASRRITAANSAP